MNKLYLLVGFICCLGFGLQAQNFGCPAENKKAGKLYDEAISALQKGNIGEGMNTLLEAIDKDPDFGNAYYALGEAHFQKGNYSQSEKYFGQVPAVCDNYKSDMWYRLGMIAYYEGRYGDAGAAIDSFLERGNGTPDFIIVADSLVEVIAFYEQIFENPVPFDPQPLTPTSTKFDEYLPVISPDNDILLFTRRLEKKSGQFSAYSGSKQVEEFSIAYKKGDTYEEGQALPPPFNAGLNEGGASLSLDNQTLIITACNLPEGYGSCDLYESHYENGEWSALANVGPWVNDSMWQSQASLSPDGETLYFTSDRAGGYGGQDLYMSKRDELGMWGIPENLGPLINTEKDDKSPFIHPDDNTLYFSSEGHPGVGGADIFVSRRQGNGSWGKPKNLGYPINSSAHDLGFFVSTDGKTGYFASNKAPADADGIGGWDIYRFPLYEEARPKKVLLVKGVVTDENGEVVKNAELELKNLETNEIKKIDVDSATGEFVFSQLFESDQMMIVNKEGYFYNSQVFEVDDEDAGTPKKLDFEMEELKVGEEFKIKNILFATDSYVITEESKKELDNLVYFLQKNPKIKLEVAGHTDNVGNDQSNKTLSENRAKAAYEYLVQKGISASRLSYKGYGESQPVATNDTEEGRALNRRTVVVIKGGL